MKTEKNLDIRAASPSFYPADRAAPIVALPSPEPRSTLFLDRTWLIVPLAFVAVGHTIVFGGQGLAG
jgi:hypothetical protein